MTRPTREEVQEYIRQQLILRGEGQPEVAMGQALLEALDVVEVAEDVSSTPTDSLGVALIRLDLCLSTWRNRA